ncbi:hypothetical protein CORC01_06320 [Colletotrichum orchidophilum]|uniref:Cyanovirin-N domain-containing protein n=1 Tax=Colletotrichum orchidophilum TaxID=1209926 RepID=A0A1G4BA73_9PEZI|nr:uncharacterized protein CORC01_06320 [Colletotrichum orchidophilum]OHE98324.1 hypothetical protein CORC01_06320 [Colletotrichum orchidophilum]
MAAAAFLKTLVLAFLLIQGAQSKDHSSHNCCLLTVEGWVPRNDWTEAVCTERYGSVANFDGVKCIRKPGNEISGDDFFAACKLKGRLDGYAQWERGSGYRGTCS